MINSNIINYNYYYNNRNTATKPNKVSHLNPVMGYIS